ncbi:YdeI/OmpD-associated family protein [Legionella jordanis]|uniref:Uncharacterized protein n=1 Tax=Legionella jordanis TaxID=456 RepID=A0A0W0VG88_9GAMM|nr:YdeI/OmpD-associated family protein [Legionella jordanis]KTD19103.1 hypothetical protein Ljor_0069 [Legionella jordanis]RMW99300.1 hypothetical protein EAW55_13925 [Legionella jordanis]VEH12931.1 Uncharacterized protein conserved in bacteria [Legionella jordanis]HAT8715293.1 hypothetical protein [Legionella jordanis]
MTNSNKLRTHSLSTSKVNEWLHNLPIDFQQVLTSDAKALASWEDITILARNEWICWIESAKKQETRERRIERACNDLKNGKRRPCCWPGCPHR